MVDARNSRTGAEKRRDGIGIEFVYKVPTLRSRRAGPLGSKSAKSPGRSALLRDTNAQSPRSVYGRLVQGPAKPALHGVVRHANGAACDATRNLVRLEHRLLSSWMRPEAPCPGYRHTTRGTPGMRRVSGVGRNSAFRGESGQEESSKAIGIAESWCTSSFAVPFRKKHAGGQPATRRGHSTQGPGSAWSSCSAAVPRRRDAARPPPLAAPGSVAHLDDR